MGRREEGRERGSWERERVRTGDVRRRVKKKRRRGLGCQSNFQLETGEEEEAQEAEEEEGLFFRGIPFRVGLATNVSLIVSLAVQKREFVLITVLRNVRKRGGGEKRGMSGSRH